jgi:hypothetical protein
MVTFESTCPWVPLSMYDWSFAVPPVVPPGCTCLAWHPVVYSVVVAFHACTIWIALELNVQLFLRFKKRGTLYFWHVSCNRTRTRLQLLFTSSRSFLTATWETIIFSVANMILHYTDNDILSTALNQVGWVTMVTGFSFVLYSRLHFLHQRKQTLRVVLGLIIVDAFLFHGPVVVSSIIGNVHFSKTIGRVFDIASYTELAFSVQETIPAGLYISLPQIHKGLKSGAGN